MNGIALFKASLYLIITIVFLPSFCISSGAEEYSLEDFYDIALKQAEKIKISEEDLYIYERQKDKALAALLPKLTAFGGYTKYTESKNSTTGVLIQPEDSVSWGLRLDQSFYLNGREIIAFKISKEQIEKSKYDLYAVKEAYIFNVASAYYDVLKAKKTLDIAKANFERLAKHRDAAAIRLKVGEVTKTDLLRAEAELSGARAEVIKAENNLKYAKAVLARIVGIVGDYDIKETAYSIEDAFDNLDLLKETAFSERVEIKSLELQRKISEEQVEYFKGAYWPTLSIEGVYARREDSPSNNMVNRESIYGAVKLNFPFFEGGLRKADVREAEAKKRQAELFYDDLKKTIGIEVENAYLDFQTQKGILRSFEDQTAFARDNYNSVSRQYEFGLANSIDVIDANTLLITSEKQLADANYNYQLSLIRLKRVTGQMLKAVVARQGGQH
jgi:outer membrane protein